jgi:lysophospholipase L1-like esterase
MAGEQYEIYESGTAAALAGVQLALLDSKADKTGTYSTLTAGGTTPDSITDAMLKQTGGVLENFTNLVQLGIAFSVPGFLNKNTGAVTAHADYACTDFIELTGVIASIRYHVKTYSNIATACLYTSGKVFISSVVVENASLAEVEGTLSDYNGATYVRFCSCNTGGFIPTLSVSKLWSLAIRGKTVDVENVTFSEHDDRTNLIDINECSLGYVNGNTDGSIHSSTSMYVTTFIPLKQGTQYYFNINYLYTGYAAFYDENKAYISGYGASSSESSLQPPFTIPSGAAYGRFTIASQSRLANAWLREFNRMSVKPSDYTEKVKTTFIDDMPTEYEGSEISIFTKILCIGDSLTEGFFNESGGSRLIMSDRAYPAKLQALTGIECTNYGYAGYNSVEWYEAYQNEDLSGYDACIIQLGVNDALDSISSSDMGTAFQNIITKVKSENNGIKIFVATITPANAYMTTTMRTYSEYIRTIVENLNDSDVYLVDLWTYGHTDDSMAYDAGHLSAYGYYVLAKDYKSYISHIIRSNPMDFRYVQFIGTSYTYSGDQTARSIAY